MPSLLGAINNYYQNSSDATITEVRNILGTGFYADVIPGDINLPYCVLSQPDSPNNGTAKGQPFALANMNVSFDVYGTGREQVEGILGLLYDAYVPLALDLTPWIHRATYYGNLRQGIVPDSDQLVWLGSLELTYAITIT